MTTRRRIPEDHILHTLYSKTPANKMQVFQGVLGLPVQDDEDIAILLNVV